MWSFKLPFLFPQLLFYIQKAGYFYTWPFLFSYLSKLLIFIHTMAKEKIKEIKGIPDYYISDKGIVYSTKISPRYNPNGEMRVLRPRTHPSGYLYVGLFVGKGPNKQRLWRRVHRVVATAFIGKIPKGKEINHKSGNKHDNSLDNLEIVSRQQNITHYHLVLKPQRNA